MVKVSLSQVQASNAAIASSLPAGLVAVFVGATSGIGEAALKEFVREANKPKCYLVGRSEEAANRIIAECQSLNPEAQVVFIQTDVSLIKEVDKLCEKIMSMESTVNILFLSAGAMLLDRSKTSEGLHALMALSVYSRLRITQLLLPLLQRSTHLARVVNIAGGNKEGSLYLSDMQALNVPLYAIRGHLATINTLGHEALATRAPDVSFIQAFPGVVNTPLFGRLSGIVGVLMRCFVAVVGRWLFVPIQESGARNVFFATSGAFSTREGTEKNGVELGDGSNVSRGVDGNIGSGVYSVDYDGTEAGQGIVDLLAQYRKKEMVEKVWEHVQEDFAKVTRE